MAFETFTKKYSTSKTVCFKLEPQYETLEHIEEDGIIKEAEYRFENYQKEKEIFDRVHKHIMEEGLSSIGEPIRNMITYYLEARKNDNTETAYSTQDILRTMIAKHITSSEFYTQTKKPSDFLKAAYKYTENEAETEVLKSFEGFLGYLSNYFTHRNTLYVSEKKNGSIATRLVHDNLPVFYSNSLIMKRVLENDICDNLSKLCQEIEAESIDILDQFPLTNRDIVRYNTMIGGIATDDKNRIQGINEYINEYNQTHEEKIPKLTQLKKLILFEKHSFSFQITNKIETDQTVYDILEELMQQLEPCISTLTSELEKVNQYNKNHIYVKTKHLKDISKSVLDDWSTIDCARKEWHKSLITRNGKFTKKDEKMLASSLKDNAYISIQQINEMCNAYLNETVDVTIYYNDMLTDLLQLKIDMSRMRKNLAKRATKGLRQDNERISTIKKLLDTIKNVERYCNTFYAAEGMDLAVNLYDAINMMLEALEPFNMLYKKISAYITSKPYSNDKVRLTFDTSTFMQGWDKDHKESNLANILMKDGDYYLAIVHPAFRKTLTIAPDSISDNVYDQMEYKQFTKANMNLPRIIRSSPEEFQLTEEILTILNEGTFKQGKKFNLEDMYKLIDFYKKALTIRPSWASFSHNYSDTRSYKNIKEFFQEVEKNCYKLEFSKVDADYIHRSVSEGRLYLFKITNKDLKKDKQLSKMNLNTIYFKMIFETNNYNAYKLVAGAEMYYRKHSIEQKDVVVHKANIPIKNKNSSTCNKESGYTFDIIKDKRYTTDQFMLHVTSELNPCCDHTVLNQDAQAYIRENREDMHVIGINRGENNLIYAVVINSKGEIVEQRSLDVITSYDIAGVAHVCDYNELLRKREQENIQRQKSWQTAGSLQELKEGFISQVIPIIAQMMVKYNAILVMEDLSVSFLKERQRVERNIYQKFENMLLSKLNYYIDQKEISDVPGSICNGYQLTNSEQGDMYLQSGFVFKLSPYKITNADPTTGFVSAFATNINTMSDIMSFFASMTDIRYNQEQVFFEFVLNRAAFVNSYKGKTDWIICSHGKRVAFKYQPNTGTYTGSLVDVTDSLIDLFRKYHIDYTSDLRAQILQMNKAEFWKQLLYQFKLVVEMHNKLSDTESYIISPVRNKDGEFFVSGVDTNMPLNADANGAYHIAHKGLMLIDKICKKEKKIAITNEEWIQYIQEGYKPTS